MNPVMQLLLIVSYAIVGMAGALFLPLAGLSDGASQVLGGILFIGLWQVQLSFFGAQSSEDGQRMDALEKLVLRLRQEVSTLKTALAENTEKGDAKDKKLVTELQMLQTYLVKMMEKESGSKKANKGDEDTGAKADKLSQEAEPPIEEDEQLTEEEIEELGLAPEEAAMILADDSPEDTGTTGDDTSGTDTPISTNESTTPQKPTSRANAKPGGVAPLPSKARPKAKIRLIKREDQLLSVVKNSLSENRIDLYLQPIVGLPSRQTKHYECFSRVRDEDGRIVLPRQYMKVAETKGLIGTIDNLLLFRLIQLVRKLGKRRAGLKFFCNMSRYSIADPEFFPQFIDFMASNQEFSNRLVFEISQEDYLTLDDDTLERLSTLGRKGFTFSMDLVTDYNQNFAELADHHFGFIKSDLKDIHAALPDERDISDQLAYLRRHGMQWIASRIENEEMVIDALDNKIELAQGYLFGEPRSVAEVHDDL